MESKHTLRPQYLMKNGKEGPHFMDDCCIRCGKKLTKVVMLEYDQRTGEYTNEPVPPEHSQGSFEFGPDCAAVMVEYAAIAMVEYAAIAKAEGQETE